MADLCIGQDCQLQDQENGDLIRCILCCVRHHITCVGIKKMEMKQPWTCSKCRTLAKTVHELKQDLASLSTIQTQMLELLQNMTEKAASEHEMRKKAEDEVVSLKTQLENAQKQLNDNLPVVPDTKPEKRPTLLLGTSLLRNIDPNKLENCKVVAKGGAKIDEVQAALEELADEDSFEEIIIVAGSIDIEEKAVDEVVLDYQSLSVSASNRTDKVTLCSVLPRTDKNLSEKTKLLNEKLEEVCNNEGQNFINLNETFLLMNGSPNKAFLLPDGLHLSQPGVENLLAGCGISTVNGTAYTENRYKKETTSLHFRGHTHPLSNFYPLKNFRYNGLTFQTSEAAYVYEKATFHEDFHTAEAVRYTNTGIQAKRLGDKIVTNPAWQEKKIDIMDNIVRTKLSMCQDAKQALTDSGDLQLIENTPHQFWGKGNDGNGINMLGNLWMTYRKKLKNGSPINPHSPVSPPSRQWATRQHQPRCYRCGEHGHLISQCRKVESVSCWKCGTQGHKQKHCGRFVNRPNRFPLNRPNRSSRNGIISQH